ncbi:hypothetical protein IVB69_01920 [Flavobacterium sp. J49]|uniref:hypothetical protein n=1 Tax=Flavobacterium sp. J49 TaxID=2718534 RepID=UPI0015945C61|nr:hypothetical protein [Flavobacterium sp. J49]MBF6640228.1 hypothetical protein [Flavobacterium sp. J49]NIC01473.1 hypothetical protein [Flavobacterium sp. J49]
MNNLKYLVFLIGFFVFSACKNQESKTEVNETEFTLNSFKTLPKEIDGCSCIFSKNEKDYEQSKFVFASNFDSIAFVSINNKVIKLKLSSRVYKPNTVENEDYICKYNTEEYKITIEIKADKTKKHADESWWNKGLISIENKNGKKVTQEFVGESGC